MALVAALNVLVREAPCTADHEADASNPPPFLRFPRHLVGSADLGRTRKHLFSPRRSGDQRIGGSKQFGLLGGSPDPHPAGAHVQACSCPPGDSESTELDLPRALLRDWMENVALEQAAAAAAASVCCTVLHHPYPMPSKLEAPKRLNLQLRRLFNYKLHSIILTDDFF